MPCSNAFANSTSSKIPPFAVSYTFVPEPAPPTPLPPATHRSKLQQTGRLIGLSICFAGLIVVLLLLSPHADWQRAKQTMDLAYPDTSSRIIDATNVRNHLLEQWGSGGYSSTAAFLADPQGLNNGSQYRSLALTTAELNLLLDEPDVLLGTSLVSLAHTRICTQLGQWIILMQNNPWAPVMRIALDVYTQDELVGIRLKSLHAGRLPLPYALANPLLRDALLPYFPDGLPPLDGSHPARMILPLDECRCGRITQLQIDANSTTLTRRIEPVPLARPTKD